MDNMAGKQEEVLSFNPLRRCEIRKDFPEVASIYNSEGFLKTLNQELLKQGTSLEQTECIYLAYPHKHPVLFPDHYNSAEKTVSVFKKVLEKKEPHIQWKSADEICETVHLERSGNQTIIHALTAHQIYEIYSSAQKKLSLFTEHPYQKKNFFVIVDSTIEQGTTVANLMSYIEHNGESVLAVASNTFGYKVSIVQETTIPENFLLSKPFNNAARNTGRLPQMAKAFFKSAKKEGFDWSPQYCLELFEESLKKNNGSVFTLTDGECMELIGTVRGCYNTSESFPSLLKKLDPQFKATLTQPIAKSFCMPEVSAAPAIS